MEQDTIHLLKECNSGIKMGVAAIDEVLDKVSSKTLMKLLSDCKDAHEKLGNQTHTLLHEHGAEGSEPNPVAKGMSWLKTNVKLAVEGSDQAIADLITDGCNMGVKSLNKYLNEYESADSQVKDLTKKLIKVEEKLEVDLRQFL